MKEFSKSLPAKEVEKLVDLDPNKHHTSWDAVVDAVKELEALCREKLLQMQSSDPSPMITREEGNKYFFSQNAEKPHDNTCKKVRPKEAVLHDISKLEKNMVMTRQRVITKSKYSEGMSREKNLRREKLLKRPIEFDDEHVMPKRLKRVVRFEDSDYKEVEEKEEELQVKKTPKRLLRKTPNNGKKEKKNKVKIEIPDPPIELPEKFTSRITAMGGKDVKLVITKRLTVSDCKNNEGRLSMPFSQIKEFLFGNEKVHLKRRNKSNGKNGIKVKLIQPNLEEIDINLRQWDMSKPKITGSKMYVLVKPWNDVVRKNALREGEAIQVWSYRVGEDELRLAIVRLSDDEKPADVGQLPYDRMVIGSDYTGTSPNTERVEESTG